MAAIRQVHKMTYERFGTYGRLGAYGWLMRYGCLKTSGSPKNVRVLEGVGKQPPYDRKISF
jgi:hypothetical protein